MTEGSLDDTPIASNVDTVILSADVKARTIRIEAGGGVVVLDGAKVNLRRFIAQLERMADFIGEPAVGPPNPFWQLGV